MNREPGYYWIWDETNARWQAAEWSGRVFWLAGDEYGMSPEELVASGLGPIGPKIEPPPDVRRRQLAG